MAASVSALWLAIAAVLAPLLSIVIFSGVPFHLIALRKNRSAALRSRLAVSRKIPRGAGLIDVPIQVLPGTLDPRIGLVHSPAGHPAARQLAFSSSGTLV